MHSELLMGPGLREKLLSVLCGMVKSAPGVSPVHLLSRLWGRCV